MIEGVLIGLLVGLVSTVFGVVFWAKVGYKITTKQMKEEITAYIKNDLPHLLESEEFKEQARNLARVFVKELITIVSEELGLKGRGDRE